MSRCRLASLSNRLFPFVENSGNRDLDVVGLHNCCYLLRFHREKVQVCWSSLVKTNHMLHQEKCIHSHLNLCLLYEIVLAGATNLIIAVCLMWKAALGCCHTFDYSCLSYVQSRAGCVYTCCHKSDYCWDCCGDNTLVFRSFSRRCCNCLPHCGVILRFKGSGRLIRCCKIQVFFHSL